MTHFLAVCPKHDISLVNTTEHVNEGALCMPDYNYEGDKSSIKYNGPEYDELGEDNRFHGTSRLWNESQQCLARDCVTMTSKAECDADTSLQPCVCYDTCPLGVSYYPHLNDWSITEPAPLEGYATDLHYTAMGTKWNHMASIKIMKPCSGKGACNYNGICHCI